MKTYNKLIWLSLAVLFIALAFPHPVSAASLNDDRVIFGETFTLESGRILDGDLILVGGVVDIQSGAVVSGDMYAVGSAGTISGTIEGSLITIGGTITLDENSVIQGDIITPMSYINEEEGSVIEGNKYLIWEFPLPDYGNYSEILPDTDSNGKILAIFNNIAEEVIVMLVLLALAALIALILPKQVEVMTDALSAKPWQMLGYGALTALAMFIGGIILTITICMIPVVILVGLAFMLAVLVGWLTLGYELGKRIASSIFKSEWHPVLSAAIGNLILYLLAKGLDFIPCIGGLIVFLAALFGLGMTVLTLFGTNPYPRETEAAEGGQIVLNKGEANVKDEEFQEDEPLKKNGPKKEKKTQKKTPKKKDS